MQKKTTITITIIILILLAAGFYFINQVNKNKNTEKNIKASDKIGEIGSAEENVKTTGFGSGQKIVIYKSQNCGCCVGYVKILEKNGFNVDVKLTDDMQAVKEKYHIPEDKQSCHTIILGDYFIEGHVPMEALKKLLKEKPSIDGIGLPRMPAGAAGMPGEKRAPYEIYQSVNGVFSNFLTI